MQAKIPLHQIRSSRGPSHQFVCEFITGGGCCGQPIPAQLAAEGDDMLTALLRDLKDLQNIRVVTTRDARLPVLGSPARVLSIAHPLESVWESGLADAIDAAWWIAPETDGTLEHWVRQTARRGIKVFGCAPEAISVTADKIETNRVLHAGGVAVIPTVGGIDNLPQSTTGWVVKPRDGAGCEGTYWCADPNSVMRRWHTGAIVQTYIPGIAASLSLLCANGAAQVLACNRQQVERDEDTFHFRGVESNALARLTSTLEPLAQRIAALIPGLWGFVGVDLILTQSGEPVVVEINPRLTSAYPGLRNSLGINVVEHILALPEPYWWSHYAMRTAVAGG